MSNLPIAPHTSSASTQYQYLPYSRTSLSQRYEDDAHDLIPPVQKSKPGTAFHTEAASPAVRVNTTERHYVPIQKLTTAFSDTEKSVSNGKEKVSGVQTIIQLPRVLAGNQTLVPITDYQHIQQSVQKRVSTLHDVTLKGRATHSRRDEECVPIKTMHNHVITTEAVLSVPMLYQPNSLISMRNAYSSRALAHRQSVALAPVSTPLLSLVLWGSVAAVLCLVLVAGVEVTTVSSGSETMSSYHFSYATLVETLNNSVQALLIYSQSNPR